MKDKLRGRFFLDTNILAYTFDHSAPRKQEIARQLVQTALLDGHGIISSQVVQEFLNLALKKFRPPLSKIDLEDYIREVLRPLCRVFPSFDLYNHALKITYEHKYHFYDCLILSAAIEGGCSVLFSEDFQDEQKIEGTLIRNPFK